MFESKSGQQVGREFNDLGGEREWQHEAHGDQAEVGQGDSKVEFS